VKHEIKLDFYFFLSILNGILSYEIFSNNNCCHHFNTIRRKMSNLHTISNKVECGPGVVCKISSAEGLSIARMNKVDKICIGCCCLIGISGLTFAIYKYISLNNRMNELERRVEKISSQLNLVDESDIEEQSIESDLEFENGSPETRPILEEESSKTKKNNRFVKFDSESVRVDKTKHSHINPVDRNASLDTITKSTSNQSLDKRTIANNQEPQKNILKKQWSSSSSLVFRTPDSSPERQSSSEKVNNQTTCFAIDDNQSLDLYLSQNYENKKLTNALKQLEYEQDKENLNICIDYIKTLYALSENELDLNVKKSLQYKAFNISKDCIENFDQCWLAHKWYAITIAKITEYMSINEKIKSGLDFKNHLDLAIKLNDKDYLLYYLRGRYFYKMCNLSWAERYGARVVFGKLPEVSLDDAYNDFLMVEKMHKNKSKGNLLYLAKVT
jgi:hypothetical protein